MRTVTKILDGMLSAAFLSINTLYRVRDRVEPSTGEENRLLLAWLDAARKSHVLQSELEHATFSRGYDEQVQIVSAARTANDKCHNLLVRLRAHRLARRKAAARK